MASVINWLQANAVLIFGVLFGLSEALAAIPAVKANSVFQAIVAILAKLAGKSLPPA